MNKRVKLIIDIAMAALLPLLMAYSLIGERFHEIAGSLMLILFIVHHILNRKWFGAIIKGKYHIKRVFRTVINLLLLIFMILQPLTGILLSKHLYTFLPAFPISARAREIHMLLAYWGLVLMSIHAGTHMTAAFSKLKKNRKNIYLPVVFLLTVIAIYGIYAFFRRGFPGYMFIKTIFAFFDFSEPRIFFIADYISIIILFGAIGYLIWNGLEKLPKGSQLKLD